MENIYIYKGYYSFGKAEVNIFFFYFLRLSCHFGHAEFVTSDYKLN